MSVHSTLGGQVVEPRRHTAQGAGETLLEPNPSATQELTAQKGPGVRVPQPLSPVVKGRVLAGGSELDGGLAWPVHSGLSSEAGAAGED